MTDTLTTDVLIIGAGTAGMYALREVRRAGKDFLLVDRGPLGTTCARVGCMPSKVLLQTGHDWSCQNDFDNQGMHGHHHMTLNTAEMLSHLRRLRDSFANPTAQNTRKSAGDKLIMGEAKFISPTQVEVNTEKGKKTIDAQQVIIANGSSPVVPSFLDPVKDRIVTTDELFELQSIPSKVGILGLGAIGLEMGIALSRLGIEVIGLDLAETLAGIQDPKITEKALEYFSKKMTLHLGHEAQVEAAETGLLLRSGKKTETVDLLLVALGRQPNLHSLNLKEAGFKLDDKGMPKFDQHTLKIKDQPVYFVGDVNADRALMHEAAHEGGIAGFNACQEQPIAFKRKTPISIAFSNPDIVAVGQSYSQLNLEQTIIGNTGSNGRARIMHSQDDLLQIYADKATGKLLGAAIIGVGAEHLAHLLAWAIERQETASSLLQMPFYHPTIEEQLQEALEDIAKQLDNPNAYPFGTCPLSVTL